MEAALTLPVGVIAVVSSAASDAAIAPPRLARLLLARLVLAETLALSAEPDDVTLEVSLAGGLTTASLMVPSAPCETASCSDCPACSGTCDVTWSDCPPIRTCT